MNIPINLFMWIMAFLPIIALLVLMMKFHWGATDAAPIGLLITVITGIAFYKADVKLISVEFAKGIWSALPILLVIATAILMYQVGDEAKAYVVIKNGMKKLLPNELLLVIAMGWLFESFLQGITGFGVPVAVGAPLLIGIGVSPMWAVIIPLLGQSWGNTFGTLAAAWDALAMTAKVPVGSSEYFVTALWAAAFIWMWNAVIGIAICWFYGKGRALKKGFPAIALMSLIQGGGELLLSQINTTLACFIPACVSLIAILLLGRTKMYKDEWSLEDSPIMNRKFAGASTDEAESSMTLVQAFVPYFLLSVITLVVLLVKPVNTFLGSVRLGFGVPETATGYGIVNEAQEIFSPLKIFTHASMFLFISSMIGLLYYNMKGYIREGGIKRIFLKSVTMFMPSSMAIVGLVIMSKVMSGTGQTVVLANGIANILGKAYAVLAPFVGLLGSFMTGSNMSSNILFGDFQVTTANLLDINASAVLGAQTAGGSVGSAVSPSNIILGATTANILGREGEVLKKIIVIAVPIVLVIGAVLFVLVGM